MKLSAKTPRHLKAPERYANLIEILNDKKLIRELYIFSGLGADERVFHRLDFSGFKTTFVKWLVPLKEESIENYSTRLLDQIKSKKPILIGLSFGGLIAVEIAKQIETEKVIIISSAKTKHEIPFYYRLAGQLAIHKFVPERILKSSNFFTNWFFGTSSTDDKKLLKQILIDADPTFLKWAIDTVVHWTNLTLTKNIFHIHGTNDRILPFKFVNCHVKIKNGGHLMILDKADELNHILRQKL